MTVVVGFVGPDGAVMCSDSQATEGEDKTRKETEKIWECNGFLFGYSGWGAVKQPLVVSIESELKPFAGKDLTCWQAREALSQASKPVLAHSYSNYVPAAPGEHAGMLKGSLLVAGREGDSYWLLELDGNNIATFYTEEGFHTIGSGSVAAQVARGLLADYEPKGRNIAHLKLLAYRTVETCIEVLGGQWGVGGHPLMWYSQDGEPFVKADDDELAATKNYVGEWTLAEKESIEKAFPTRAEDVEPSADDLPAPPGDDE
jgi:ATP-dependent protease HslVU (ClpYQ) peptidase subunit